MAWHITFFLKSLRSLEEFRKNPHVKIPPKSPSTNFQSLVVIKNQILFGKEFFSVAFGPAATHLFSPSLQLSHPKIFISECEPFFQKKLKFSKGFHLFELKIINFIYFVFIIEFKESKHLNDVQFFPFK